MIDKKTQVFTDNDAGNNPNERETQLKKLCQINRINEAFPIDR